MKNLSEEERVSLRRSIKVIVDPVLDGVSELTKKKVFDMFERYGDYYGLNIQEIATWEQFMGYSMMVGVIEKFPKEISKLFQQETKTYLEKVSEIKSLLSEISNNATICNKTIVGIQKELKNVKSIQNEVKNLVQITCNTAVEKVLKKLPNLTIEKNDNTLYYFRDTSIWNSIKYFIVKNTFSFGYFVIAMTAIISSLILSNMYHKHYIDNDNDRCEMYGENYWLCKTSDNKVFEIVIDSAENKVRYRMQEEILENAQQHSAEILLDNQ